jgi:hypothetical protein
LSELLVLAYATAVGFAAAGIASTFYQWVTARPVAFVLPSGRIVACVLAGVSFALVGPYIVARTAIRSVTVDRRPATWLVGGFAIVLLWSACSGILVLDLALSLRHGLV